MSELVHISLPAEAKGSAIHTKVTAGDGVELKSISSIQISGLKPNGLVLAEIHLLLGGLDIYAQAFMSEENMIAAADHYGYSIKKENSDV